MKGVAVLSSGCGYHAWNLTNYMRDVGIDANKHNMPIDYLPPQDVLFFVGCFPKDFEYMYQIQHHIKDKKVIVAFVGTDVCIYNERLNEEMKQYVELLSMSDISRAFFKDFMNHENTTVVAMGEHLVKELNEAGVKEVGILTFVSPTRGLEDFPDEPSALSYMHTRGRFFNMPMVLDVADSLPDLTFGLYGGEKFESVLKNIKNYGWVTGDEKVKVYKDTTICLRIPRHDGIPQSMIELLQMGRRAIWIYDHLPFVKSLPENFGKEDVINAVEEILEYDEPDKEASEYYRKHYSLHKLKNDIKNILDNL